MANPETSSWDTDKQTKLTPPTVWSAAKANDVDELRRLLDGGAGIDDRDHRGYTALMLAAHNGNDRAFTFLIERRADVNGVDLVGNSVLMGAAFKGQVRIVEALLAAGADVTIKNHQGMDAAGFANTAGRSDVSKLLEQRRSR